MDRTVPEIYSPRWIPQRLQVGARCLWGALAMACLGVMILAATLWPSPTGIGTHSEIGLESCRFLARTGLPCGTCGMTTSWTWFARGNLAASFYVQPMGFVLAVLCVLLFWIGSYLAISGRNPSRLLIQLPMTRILIGLLAFGLLAWGWKIFIHLNGMDGWG